MPLLLRWTARLVCIWLLFLILTLLWRWPFTQAKAVTALEHFASSRVQIGAFQRVYFPYPGYIARHVRFSREVAGRSIQLASVESLQCKSWWWTLLALTHHAKELDIQGLVVTLPSVIPPAMKLHPDLNQHTSVEKLVADGTVLEIAARERQEKVILFFPKFALGQLEKGKPVTLEMVMRNQKPAGDLTVKATLGPIALAAVWQTELSGNFALTHANLHDMPALRGSLEAYGQFKGTLAQCQVQGSAHSSQFEVLNSGHPVDLSANVVALVEGQHGNVTIQSLVAHFSSTIIRGSGAVSNEASSIGKTVNLKLNSQEGRIEDLLRVFTTLNPVPLEGPLRFQAQVQLLAEKKQFLQRLTLKGTFLMRDGRFTEMPLREKVGELSKRAQSRGHQAESGEGSSDLSGSVHLQNAKAELSDLVFRISGATAKGQGTYDLLTKKIDLNGKLAMQASLSKAAGGIKSILLLPFDAFFKGQNAGAILPVQIIGEYPHPQFRISLKHAKATHSQ